MWCIVWKDRDGLSGTSSVPCKYVHSLSNLEEVLSDLEDGEKVEVHKCVPIEKTLEYNRI